MRKADVVVRRKQLSKMDADAKLQEFAEELKKEKKRIGEIAKIAKSSTQESQRRLQLERYENRWKSLQNAQQTIENQLETEKKEGIKLPFGMAVEQTKQMLMSGGTELRKQWMDELRQSELLVELLEREAKEIKNRLFGSWMDKLSEDSARTLEEELCPVIEGESADVREQFHQRLFELFADERSRESDYAQAKSLLRKTMEEMGVSERDCLFLRKSLKERTNDSQDREKEEELVAFCRDMLEWDTKKTETAIKMVRGKLKMVEMRKRERRDFLKKKDEFVETMSRALMYSAQMEAMIVLETRKREEFLQRQEALKKSLAEHQREKRVVEEEREKQRIEEETMKVALKKEMEERLRLEREEALRRIAEFRMRRAAEREAEEEEMTMTMRNNELEKQRQLKEGKTRVEFRKEETKKKEALRKGKMLEKTVEAKQREAKILIAARKLKKEVDSRVEADPERVLLPTASSNQRGGEKKLRNTDEARLHSEDVPFFFTERALFQDCRSKLLFELQNAGIKSNYVGNLFKQLAVVPPALAESV